MLRLKLQENAECMFFMERSPADINRKNKLFYRAKIGSGSWGVWSEIQIK